VAQLQQALWKSDLVITPSIAVRDQLRARFPTLESKIHVVPHGPQLRPCEKQYLENHRPFALTIACLETRKNILTLLRAFERLDLDLVLIGRPGFGGKEILNAIASHPRRENIHLLTNADDRDMAMHLSACEVYVQPSLDEGFGMPVLDAMEFGKPIVASNIPAMRELCADGALYFELTDSADGLYDAVRNVLTRNQVREKISGLAKTRAKNFSWDTSVRRLLSLYNSIL
jgi:glycosyltransferase involved in cell wall biosynthesis